MSFLHPFPSKSQPQSSTFPKLLFIQSQPVKLSSNQSFVSCHSAVISASQTPGSPPPPLHDLSHRCLVISSQPSSQKLLKLSHIKLHSSQHHQCLGSGGKSLSYWKHLHTSWRGLSAKGNSIFDNKNISYLHPVICFVSITIVSPDLHHYSPLSW